MYHARETPSVVMYETGEFISQLASDIEGGRCVVPLIGSGLSSPSGIIMGSEFTTYLSFAFYLVLSEPSQRKRTRGEGQPSRWDLRTQGWPPMPSESEGQAAKKWIREQFEELCTRLGFEVNYDGSLATKMIRSVSARDEHESLAFASKLAMPCIPKILVSHEARPQEDHVRRFLLTMFKRQAEPPMTSRHLDLVDHLVSLPSRSYKERVLEVGIRSLHDWRETLVFLSSVQIPQRRQLQIGTQDPSVIDAFNQFITRDRLPNLGHKMIAQLSGPLRMHPILTTNFDDLTEEAFREIGIAVRVLPVSTEGQLPEPRIVAANDSIVKLHGEVQNTRADLSLDDEPAFEDLEAFRAYLTRGSGNLFYNRKTETASKNVATSKILLVLGYSGADHRCIQMIKHWLETGPEGARVYWVCFSQKDIRRVSALFSAVDYAHKVKLTSSSRPDLLLYELYQQICFSLPPGGTTYEFSQCAPPKRKRQYDSSPERVSTLLNSSNTGDDLLHAARLLIGNSLDDSEAKKICRDAMVSSTASLIEAAATSPLQFYERDGRYRPLGNSYNAARLWRPYYRDSRLPKWRYFGEEADEKLLLGIRSVPIVIDAPGGIVRSTAIAVENLQSESSKKVFWLETQDYMDADALLRDLLRSIASRFGSYNSKHTTTHPLSVPIAEYVEQIRKVLVEGKSNARKGYGYNAAWLACAKKLASHLVKIADDYRVDPQQIVVLLYGRDGYGNCSGLVNSEWCAKQNHQFKAMHCIIEALGIAGIRAIYFPLGKKRAKTKVRLLKQVLGKKERAWSHDSLAFHKTEPQLVSDDLSVFEQLVDAVIQGFLAGEAFGEKLVFLYALTLFRHSRPPNALRAEAVFACPFRFNANGIDNDFIRSSEVDAWLGVLRDSRVFFDKPGGAFWIHRDLRHAFRICIEKLKASERPEGVDFRPIATRSRLHFWIADWYQKAYFSSRHLDPVIESLHHRVEACIHAWSAMPRALANLGTRRAAAQLLKHRQLRFSSSLNEASSLLLSARNALKFWQAAPFDPSWLSEMEIARTEEALNIAMQRILDTSKSECSSKALCESQEAMTSTIEQFVQMLYSTRRDIAIEGGAEVRSIGASRRIFLQRNVERKLERRSDFVQVPIDIESDFEFECSLQRTFESQVDFDIGDLFTTFRQFSKSCQRNGKRLKAVQELSRSKGDWAANTAGNPTHLMDMIWVLNEYSFLHLRRAKLAYHATGIVKHSSWVRICVACNVAGDLTKYLPPAFVEYETRSLARLNTTYSLALANLGRFHESSRRLNESQAILVADPSVTRADYAAVALRRAECLLTEIFAVTSHMKALRTEAFGSSIVEVGGLLIGKCKSLAALFDREEIAFFDASKGDIRSCINRLGKKLDRTFFASARVSSCFAKGWVDSECDSARVASALQSLAIGLIDEAEIQLERGEKGLIGASQSSLWWSRLYSLRLRLYTMLAELPGELAVSSSAFRKQPPDKAVYEAFLNAARSAADDPLRQYRAVTYFAAAEKWLWEFFKMEDQTKSPLPDTLKKAAELYRDLLSRTGKSSASPLLTLALSRFRDEYAKIDRWKVWF